LLAALAILLAAALGFGYFAQKNIQSLVAAQDKMIQQGMVSYYKLIPPQ
jgi:hypothetical protein